LKDVVVTEKIDGTNGLLYITEWDGEQPADHDKLFALSPDRNLALYVGSRSRWLEVNTAGQKHDNFGFARWAEQHLTEIFDLGVGKHYGEWWGQGIQRGYGQVNRYFSLFNPYTPIPQGSVIRTVPIMWQGAFINLNPMWILEDLREHGSYAAPGYAHPEGVVVYHEAATQSFKLTFDDRHKGGVA
jgi:hypothetical protein